MLLGTAVLAALPSCATKPRPEPLANLRLYGADGRWGGVLTRQHLTLTGPSGVEGRVVNPGFPCPGPAEPCFFGGVGHSRYVNAVMPAGQRVSLVADREPCRDAQGRAHPYTAKLYLHAEGQDPPPLLGCAGPLRTSRRR